MCQSMVWLAEFRVLAVGYVLKHVTAVWKRAQIGSQLSTKAENLSTALRSVELRWIHGPEGVGDGWRG